MTLSADAVNHVFAWLPWVLLLSVLVAVYLVTRGEARHVVPIGKTYSCANCGRRGDREHMVPVAREGSVVWYCRRCSTRT